MVWLWTLTADNVQRMQVTLVTVLRRWRGDGMICHAQKNSQLQKNNVQCRVPRCRVETSKHALTAVTAQNEKFIAG